MKKGVTIGAGVIIGLALISFALWAATKVSSKDGGNGCLVSAGSSDTAAAAISRGREQYQKKDLGCAISIFTEAIKLQPNLAEPFYQRGNVLIEAGKASEAIGDFNRAIELDPSRSSIFAARGFAYDLQIETSKAKADYDRAIELDAKNSFALIKRGRLYFSQQKFDLASVDLDQALQIDPNSVEASDLRELARHRIEAQKVRDADFTIFLDLITGERSADEIAVTHKGKTMVFEGQITGRDTQGNATVVELENGRGMCRFLDVQQRLAVSKIGRGCYVWTGTLSRVSAGRLYFDNCSFRSC